MRATTRDLLLLFRVPHTPFLRVGPRFLSPAVPHAGAPSFVPALRAGGACALEDVAKGGSAPCSPTRAHTHICHHEEVRPHVFMRMNDEASAFAFSGAPHAVLACGSSFSVSRSPACGCPILRVLCEGWVGLCSPGRPPHFAGPWGFFLRFKGDAKP
jgi:hypothetical protein